jgi:hypothetical protein
MYLLKRHAAMKLLFTLRRVRVKFVSYGMGDPASIAVPAQVSQVSDLNNSDWFSAHATVVSYVAASRNLISYLKHPNNQSRT